MNLPSVQKSFSSVSSISRAIVICAVSLCFAGMVPAAFAQRGGGGHVGGGGGGHVSGSFHSAGNFSSGSRTSASYGGRASGGSGYRTSGAPVYASGVTNRGYSRTYFVADPRSGAGVSSFVGSSSAASGTRSFAANNRVWQEPPQQGRAAIMPRRAFMSSFTNFRHVASGSPYVGMTATPPRFTPNGLGPFFNNPLHPFGPNPCIGEFGGCGFGTGFIGSPFLNPFFFGFGFSPCFTGFGCGFGPFGFGDLDWGGMGLDYGYGNGWYYPTDEEAGPPPENSTEDNQPPNYAPGYYFVPPPGEAEAAPAQPQQPVVKLVLTDGTIFGVYSYWLQDNQLYYITTYNIKTSIPIGDLDLQKTVDLNAKLGTTFTLSPKPPDQQQDQDQQPPDQQQ